MLDICIVIIVLLAGFNIKKLFKERLTKKDNKVLDLLWVYHLLFAFIFYFYVNANGGDARNYWFTVKENIDAGFLDYFSLGFGTYFMYALNYFPSKILGLSFMTGSLLYALLGYVGFIYFYIIFKERIDFNTRIFKVKLFPFLFFLPNLHFWTSNVGKDTLLFFCIALFCYGVQKPKEHIIKIVIALALAYFARPHIAVFLILAFGIGVVTHNSLKAYQKIFFIALLSTLFVLFFDTITTYLRIESFNLDTISNYSEDKVTKLSRENTGSSVDISSYPFPLKVFTFLYRPLFFDINGVMAIIASMENLVLLILSIKLLWLNPFKVFKAGDYFIRSLFVFLIFGVVTFSLILGNLGIMLRQKNMFIPSLLFICLWAFSNQLKNEADKKRIVQQEV